MKLGVLFCLLVAAASAQTTQSPVSREEKFKTHHLLGEGYAKNGKLAQAILEFERAAALNPSGYVNGFDLATAYFQAGKLDQARTQILKMLAREDTAELHNLLGAVHEGAGDLDSAGKEYQRAAEMDPSEKFLFDYGSCMLKYEQSDAAIKIFDYGVRKYPRSAMLRVSLGVALYSRAYYDEAVKVLCEAVDLDPSDSRALYFLGEMHDISVALGDEVTRRLAHFVDIYPENAAANYYYAVSLWKRNTGGATSADLKDVERLLRTALRIDHSLDKAHFQLGVLCDEQDRQAEAAREYSEAARLRPDEEKYHYRLAVVWRRLGKTEEAQREFEVVRRLRATSAALPPVGK